MGRSSTSESVSAGWDAPGLRRRRLAGRARPRRRAAAHRAPNRAARPGRRGPPGKADGARPDASRSSTAAQNVAGWVRLQVRGRAGMEVRVRHAEVLEADGSLHVRALRSAKATDTYVLADDADTVLAANVHVPRVPLRRGRVQRRAPRRRDRRDQQRHARRGLPSSVRTIDLTGSTPTSCGRNGTTSSRCRRTARSATSGWVGPATSRCSRRPARPSSTRGVLAKLAARPRLGAGRGARRPERGPERGARRAAPDGAGRLGGRGDDRSVGGVRGVRRPDRPRRTSGRACARGSIRSPRAGVPMGS